MHVLIADWGHISHHLCSDVANTKQADKACQPELPSGDDSGSLGAGRHVVPGQRRGASAGASV